MELNADITPFDRRIDCAMLNTGTVGETWKIKRGLESRRRQHLDNIRILNSTRYDIIADPKLDIQVDGEVIENVGQFRVSVLPGALEVFTP
jgi:diacylglycerol kinase family enzyme